MNEFYSSIHHTTIRIRVLALQAMLFSAEGDESQAVAALSDAIALAAPSGFLRLFVALDSTLTLSKIVLNITIRCGRLVNEALGLNGFISSRLALPSRRKMPPVEQERY